MVLGHYGEGGIPVLISNTEVKPFSAYGTCGLPCWESRSWPRTIDTTLSIININTLCSISSEKVQPVIFICYNAKKMKWR
jgi:hypothetical protein